MGWRGPRRARRPPTRAGRRSGRPRLRRHSGAQSARSARRVSSPAARVRVRNRTSSQLHRAIERVGQVGHRVAQRLQRAVEVEADPKRSRRLTSKRAPTHRARPASARASRPTTRTASVLVATTPDLLVGVEQDQRPALAEVAETRRRPVAHPVVLVAPALRTQPPRARVENGRSRARCRRVRAGRGVISRSRVAHEMRVGPQPRHGQGGQVVASSPTTPDAGRPDERASRHAEGVKTRSVEPLRRCRRRSRSASTARSTP